MRYAIVDIETTGSVHQGGAIMEIAIEVLEDGERLAFYETLINPQTAIPPFVANLTGIRPYMVREAPCFEDVAPRIFALLKNCVFVAHNVQFDYPFVRQRLEDHGFFLDCPQLCTIRLARKLIPGMQSYALGKLCRSLNIPLEKGHRASSDVRATTELFKLLKRLDQQGYMDSQLKAPVNSSPSTSPSTFGLGELKRIPEVQGIFYLFGRHEEVLYIGSARNLQQRVYSLLMAEDKNPNGGLLQRRTRKIRVKAFSSRLMARIKEISDISELQPTLMKGAGNRWPLYHLIKYQNRQGYTQLSIVKSNEERTALYSFHSLRRAQQFLRFLEDSFDLGTLRPEAAIEPTWKEGAGLRMDPLEVYNRKVDGAIEWMMRRPRNFLLVDKGRRRGEQSFFLVKNGIFKGMGYLNTPHPKDYWEHIEKKMERIPHSEYILSLVTDQAQRYPERCHIIP